MDNYIPLNPAPRDLRRASLYKHGSTLSKVRRVIAYGVPGTGMAPFRDTLKPKELEQAAQYVISLQEDAPARADILWTQHCATCHGVEAAGTPEAPSLRSRSGYRRGWDLVSIIRSVRSGGGKMPAFGSKLPPADIELLAHWLTLQQVAP